MLHGTHSRLYEKDSSGKWLTHVRHESEHVLRKPEDILHKIIPKR